MSKIFHRYNLLRLTAWLLIAALVLNFESITALHFTSWAQVDIDIECDQDSDDYQECMNEKKDLLEEKIDQSQQQAQTLNNAINLINNQTELQRLQIAQTQAEISRLERELADLSERIEGLVLSLDRLSEMLIVRAQAVYKQKRTHPLIALFTSNTFSEFINQYEYLKQAERQIARAMQEAESQRLLYDEQKSLKEIKQAQLEEKRRDLQAQQYELEKNKQAKQRLLADTKNDEVTYQKLLREAQRELASYRSFVTAQFGSAYCLDSPAPQPDGMFFSQRDSRWCNTAIGNSSYSIGAVGCLITSTAMIWQNYGHSITPVDIARDPSNFVLNTALMRNPIAAPPGYTYNRSDKRDLDLIDQELEANRPVIVRVSVTFNRYATHFIVLKSGSNGDYIMNDPLYKADMNFSDKYTTGQITSVRTFTPT